MSFRLSKIIKEFFVPFGTFFAHVSTPTTTTTKTTTKLVLGPLSRARGQKLKKIYVFSQKFCHCVIHT